MPKFEIDTFNYIEIDPKDYVRECSDREIADVIEALVDEGHLPNSVNYMYNHDYSISEMDFENALNNLHGKYQSLTSEQEQLIIDLSRKV